MSADMTQIKFTIESNIVAAFKSRCAAEGTSMTAVIRRWMKTCHPSKDPKFGLLTRPQRRKAVQEIIGALNKLAESEGDYRDNIPEAFEQRREAAEHTCENFEEALGYLEDAYS
jgi:hypothetical protein